MKNLTNGSREREKQAMGTNSDFQSRQMEMKTSQGFCLLASELTETKAYEESLLTSHNHGYYLFGPNYGPDT